MEFRILGPVDVVHEGRSLPLGGSRERGVLALLLLSANRVVSVERLVADLWGDAPPDGGVQALRVFVSRLRKAFRDVGDDEVIVTRSPGYLAHVDPGALDAARFEALVAQGRECRDRGDHQEEATALRHALGLWRGPALADVTDAPLARAEAARLEETRLVALEERVHADLACGRHAELVPELEALTRAHPLREGLWGQRMVALYRCGRQADALRAYRDLTGILGEELGIAPSVPLAQLEVAILRQQPELQWPPMDAPAPAPPAQGPVTPPPVPAAAPPAEAGLGRVSTFLFTDITASTRRWEHHRADMAAALARHDELLEAAVRGQGGRVFKHTGDGICAVFSAPRAALAAAVTGQRFLLAEAWGSVGPLSVRMAVHAGTAEERQGDFFGPALNRLARMLELAHGNQVLVSEACRALFAEEPAEAVELVDLGEHRLRDFERPERIFQVVHPELPDSFPPVRARRAERHNLPVMASLFVGRRRELAEIGGLLADAHLVTLVGPGGAGKTRLAVEAGADAADDFPDGAFFVDLAPLTEATQVISRAVASLGIVVDGIEGDASEGGRRRLVEHLRSRQALIVLDNCEHVLDEAARLAADVLGACPGVRLLATSREALRVPGEAVWPIPPLSLPAADDGPSEASTESDAMALFYDRAAAVDPAFRPGPDNHEAVSRICRRLDGIPLALELAAARIRVLSADDLAARLDDRFRLLTGGSRTAAPRHQTLRAALDWGHELLTDDERVVLRRLAPFRGPFDLEAAEAVVADGDVVRSADVLDLIARLVDKSWLAVERDRAVRYRCSETIRQYAAEQLDSSGEADDVQRRHCHFYLAIVTQKRAALVNPAEWVDQLRASNDNVRAALEWALSAGDNVAALRFAAALFNYWYLSGQAIEGITWIERALAVSTALRRPARVGALNGLGYLRRQLGDRDGAIRLHEEAYLVAREIGDVVGQAMSRLIANQIEIERGAVEEARRLLDEAHDALEGGAGPLGARFLDYDRGWIALATGDAESAETLFRQFRDELGTTSYMESSATAALALTAALRGDAAGSRALGDEALEAGRHSGLPEVLVGNLTRIAEAAVMLGDHDWARQALSESLPLLLEIGARAWLALSLEVTAVVLSADPGRPLAVAQLVGAAEATRQRTGESFRWPHLQAALDRGLDRARSAVEPSAFTGATTQGRDMEPEHALALALAELRAHGQIEQRT